MKSDTIGLVEFVEMTLEARACSVAILANDFDEARFRATLVAAKAETFRQDEVAIEAAAAVRTMGPLGTEPGSGYGIHMLAMAKALDAIKPEGLERETDPI